MTAGHGEYWTKGERDAFEAARAGGMTPSLHAQDRVLAGALRRRRRDA